MDFEQMYYYLESKQDTILFGQECKRLESKILYPFSEEKVADIFVYQSGDTVFYAIDSLAGELMDTSFHILYNFAAVPGDVWPLGIGDYLGYEDIICGVEPEAYVIVDSVNVETIAGLTLKKALSIQSHIGVTGILPERLMKYLVIKNIYFPIPDVMLKILFLTI